MGITIDRGSSVLIENILEAIRVDDVYPIVVGPGCSRRDLPSTNNLRVWVVDMAPGSIWPVLDVHDAGEEVYVVSGEIIEGEQRFGAGTYLFFKPGSSHRPRTDTGARLFGINPIFPSRTS
ncbi:MAG: cupin domain-containing protein [Gammaproteobacteria bacterium]